MQDLLLPQIEAMGLSIARVGIIDTEFEPINDNDDPYVIDYNSFNHDALPLKWMKNLSENSSIDKFVLTVWSPPKWMKKNQSLKAEYDAFDNRLMPQNYEEYAEMLVAVINTIKAETGITLYGISIQNEPQFNEPYASCILYSEDYAVVFDVVATRFINEGITTKLFLPEVVTEQGSVGSYISGINKTQNANMASIIGIHNYDLDGINVGNAGAKTWIELKELADGEVVRDLWMSETSGYLDTYAGAMNLGGSIYNALVYGDINAWIWWSLNDLKGSSYGLLANGEFTSRAAISAQYYKHARENSIRFEVASTNEDLLSLGFINEDGTKSIILTNPTDAPMPIEIFDEDLTYIWDLWQTQEYQMHEYMGIQKTNTSLLPPQSVSSFVSVVEE